MVDDNKAIIKSAFIASPEGEAISDWAQGLHAELLIRTYLSVRLSVCVCL